MNQINVVMQWWLDGSINDEDFITCMSNLGVTPLSIGRLMKLAQHKRSKNKAVKPNATSTQEKTNTQEEV